MTKEKYKEHIKNTRDSALNGIAGFHEHDEYIYLSEFTVR